MEEARALTDFGDGGVEQGADLWFKSREYFEGEVVRQPLPVELWEQPDKEPWICISSEETVPRLFESSFT